MNGDELRALRKSARMSAGELAETLGYSRQHWSQYETNKVTIPPVVEYGARWVCENRLVNVNPSMSAAERAVEALVSAIRQRELA